MDPMTAIGLAGSIVQFVSFSHEFVSLGKEIYKSSAGAREQSIELDTMIQDLSAIHESLLQSWSTDPARRSKQENNIANLVTQCEPIYKELRGVLAGLQVQGDHRKWKSFCKAVKSVWKEDQINNLEKRLHRLQQQIDSHLINDIRSEQNSAVALLQDLAESSRRLEINRAKDLQAIKFMTEAGFKALCKVGKKTNVTSGDSSIGDANTAPANSNIGSGTEETTTPQGTDVGLSISNIGEANFNSAVLNTTLIDKKLKGQENIHAAQTAKIPGHGAQAIFLNLSEQVHRAVLYAAERRIIQELSFAEMKQRQLDIRQAHYETFKWAGDATLVPASFYFWSGGTSMQKSIDGLLRSLVCQVLRQCPSLIPNAFPEHWQSLMDAERGKTAINLSFDRYDIAKAFQSFTGANDQNTKFCFFIDGLDEYDGFDREIAALVKTLASSPAIKVCLASRPHNIFVSDFGSNPKQMIYIHEFTDWDIRQYIKTVFQGDPAFISCKDQDPQGYQELAESIRKDANGVFLWVYLVVLQLLDGIQNADRMSDLQRRLDRLPKDLRSLFSHMLNAVEEVYHEQQAQMLLVVCQAHGCLSPIGLSFLDEEDPDFAINCPVKDLPYSVVERRFKDTRKRIVARCRLLLEVDRGGIPVEFGDHFRDNVTFLHRTVRDYLLESEAQQLLKSRLKTSFNPGKTICNLFLAQLKLLGPSSLAQHQDLYWRKDGAFNYFVTQFMHFAKEYEKSEGLTLGIKFKQIERTAQKRLSGSSFSWWDQEVRTVEPSASRKAFLKIVIQHQLSIYLDWRFQRERIKLNSQQVADLLTCILLPEQTQENNDAIPNADVLKAFLDQGADPNFCVIPNQLSPWQRFLRSLFESNNTHLTEFALGGKGRELDQQRTRALELLILQGADPDITCVFQVEKQGIVAQQTDLTIEEIVQTSISSDNARYLIELLRRQRQKQKFNSWLSWIWRSSS